MASLCLRNLAIFCFHSAFLWECRIHVCSMRWTLKRSEKFLHLMGIAQLPAVSFHEMSQILDLELEKLTEYIKRSNKDDSHQVSSDKSLFKHDASYFSWSKHVNCSFEACLMSPDLFVPNFCHLSSLPQCKDNCGGSGAKWEDAGENADTGAGPWASINGGSANWGFISKNPIKIDGLGLPPLQETSTCCQLQAIWETRPWNDPTTNDGNHFLSPRKRLL